MLAVITSEGTANNQIWTAGVYITEWKSEGKGPLRSTFEDKHYRCLTLLARRDAITLFLVKLYQLCTITGKLRYYSMPREEKCEVPSAARM